MKLIIKREGGLQDIPFSNGDMSRFLKEWLLMGKRGLDGVVGGCSTLHQQGCSLTGPHGRFPVVPAFPEDFPHYFSDSICQIFVVLEGCKFY